MPTPSGSKVTRAVRGTPSVFAHAIAFVLGGSLAALVTRRPQDDGAASAPRSLPAATTIEADEPEEPAMASWEWAAEPAPQPASSPRRAPRGARTRSGSACRSTTQTTSSRPRDADRSGRGSDAVGCPDSRAGGRTSPAVAAPVRSHRSHGDPLLRRRRVLRGRRRPGCEHARYDHHDRGRLTHPATARLRQPTRRQSPPRRQAIRPPPTRAPRHRPPRPRPQTIPHRQAWARRVGALPPRPRPAPRRPARAAARLSRPRQRVAQRSRPGTGSSRASAASSGRSRCRLPSSTRRPRCPARRRSSG